MSKTVWLKWDGVYNLNGQCNQRLLPLVEGENQIKAIKQHLELLGFDCGKRNNDLNRKTKLALLMFNGFFNHPEISMEAELCKKCGITRLLPFKYCETEEPAEAEPDELVEVEVEPDELVEVEDPDDQGHDTEFPLEKYCDGQTIELLEDLNKQWVSEDVVDEEVEHEPQEINLSRSHDSRIEPFGGTLHSITGMAVKVVSTPNSFKTFFEFATIEIAIEGFQEVKSLLFRVYHLFDENKDQIEVVPEKLVYQEIIDRETLIRLPVIGPDDNKEEHDEAKAHIMKLIVGNALEGSFGNYLHTSYDRIKSPYKVRIWVSKEADKFQEFEVESGKRVNPNDKYIFDYGVAGAYDKKKAEEKAEFRKQMLSKLGTTSIFQKKPTFDKGDLRRGEKFGKSVIDIKLMAIEQQMQIEETQEEVKKEQKEIASKEQLEKSTKEPQADNVATIHDQSNKEDKESSVKEIRDFWESNEANLFWDEEFWTAENSTGTNLIGEICDKGHNIDFLIRNQIRHEDFPDRFAQNPVKTYKMLRERLDTEGDNFKYPELGEAMVNVKRHSNLIRRRICCGQWSHLEEQKESIDLLIENTITPELNQLILANCPNDDSIIFFEKFMQFFSYVVYQAVVLPEIKFFNGYTLGENRPNNNQMLRDRRKKIDGFRSPVLSPLDGVDQLSLEESFSPLKLTGNYADHKTARKAYLWKDKNEKWGGGLKSILETHTGHEIRDNEMPRRYRKFEQIAKVILLPSYNPLSVGFFITIRAVPMYMIGLLDMQYLTADGIRQSPGGFFRHDLFHAILNALPTRQQYYTLYNRLFDVIIKTQNIRNDLDEWTVYEKWEQNGQAIDEFLKKYPNILGETMGFILFWLLHEPLSAGELVGRWLAKSEVYTESEANNLWKNFPLPAVSEREILYQRLIYGTPKEIALYDIELEDSRDFFGKYSRPYMKYLKSARDLIANNLIPKLKDLTS